MARILIERPPGEGRAMSRAEVTDDPEDGTGIWDCETCGDGAMMPNLIEAIHGAIVHVDHHCRGVGK